MNDEDNVQLLKEGERTGGRCNECLQCYAAAAAAAAVDECVSIRCCLLYRVRLPSTGWMGRRNGHVHVSRSDPRKLSQSLLLSGGGNE